MHGCSCFRLFLISLLLMAGVAPAEPLPWVLLPLPGIVNLAEGQPSDGVQVEALHLLERRLGDVQPSYRVANRLRQQQDMAQGANFCAAPFLQRTDSDRTGYFIPFLVSTPIQAVIRRGEQARFPIENGRLSLVRLLADERLTGGLPALRTYPREIRELLRDGVAWQRLEKFGGALGGENLLLMVGAGRIDYSFEFATVTRQLNADRRLQGKLLSLPLQETHKLEQSGIYCTRNPWGLRMAERLDQAIRDVSRQPEDLLVLYREWLPEETYQAYATELRAYYRQRSTQRTELR